MNNGQGKPCICIHCKQVMYRKRIYDHCRSKHKEYFEKKKERLGGMFKPTEGEDFDYEGVDMGKLPDDNTEVQYASKGLKKASTAANSQGGNRRWIARDSSSESSSASSCGELSSGRRRSRGGGKTTSNIRAAAAQAESKDKKAVFKQNVVKEETESVEDTPKPQSQQVETVPKSSSLKEKAKAIEAKKIRESVEVKTETPKKQQPVKQKKTKVIQKDKKVVHKQTIPKQKKVVKQEQQKPEPSIFERDDIEMKNETVETSYDQLDDSLRAIVITKHRVSAPSFSAYLDKYNQQFEQYEARKRQREADKIKRELEEQQNQRIEEVAISGAIQNPESTQEKMQIRQSRNSSAGQYSEKKQPLDIIVESPKSPKNVSTSIDQQIVQEQPRMSEGQDAQKEEVEVIEIANQQAVADRISRDQSMWQEQEQQLLQAQPRPSHYAQPPSVAQVYARDRLVLDLGPVYGEVVSLRQCCEQNFHDVRSLVNHHADQIQLIQKQNQYIIEQQSRIFQAIQQQQQQSHQRTDTTTIPSVFKVQKVIPTGVDVDIKQQ